MKEIRLFLILFLFFAVMGVQDSNNIIELLKQSDKATLEKIYIENREAFINFAKKYNIEKYDAVDIYQDAIIALQENAINGKLSDLKSNISTYLFAIGKYKIFHSHRKNSKIEYNNDIELEEKSLTLDVNFIESELTNKQRVLKKYFIKLGERCKSVLSLFYYQGYTLDEITGILDYSDKKVLKSQKSRCMKQLKKMVNKT